MQDSHRLIRRIRLLLWFFILALLLSGVTAFPLRWEIGVLYRLIARGMVVDQFWPAMADWLAYVYQGIMVTYDRYPFMAYGTDWLAFAHLVIAIAFVGPLRDPVKNVWVVEFGMIACLLVIPLALIGGPLRGIPLFWRLIDSAVVPDSRLSRFPSPLIHSC